MNPGLTLGRIAGVRISVHWSWLIVFALITWTLAAAIFPDQNPGLSNAAYAAMAVVASVTYFASLLLHELGHAMQARRERLEIDGITLWLFGGVAAFRGDFPSALGELRIALAGPAVTAFLSAAFWLLSGVGAAGGRGRRRHVAGGHQPRPPRVQHAACPPARRGPRAPRARVALDGRSTRRDDRRSRVRAGRSHS